MMTFDFGHQVNSHLKDYVRESPTVQACILYKMRLCTRNTAKKLIVGVSPCAQETKAEQRKAKHQKMNTGAGDLAQWLKALTVLPQDLRLNTSINIFQLDKEDTIQNMSYLTFWTSLPPREAYCCSSDISSRPFSLKSLVEISVSRLLLPAEASPISSEQASSPPPSQMPQPSQEQEPHFCQNCQ